MLKERIQKVVLQATESIYLVHYTLSVSLRLIQNSSVENEGTNTGLHQGTSAEGTQVSILFWMDIE